MVGSAGTKRLRPRAGRVEACRGMVAVGRSLGGRSLGGRSRGAAARCGVITARGVRSNVTSVRSVLCTVRGSAVSAPGRSIPSPGLSPRNGEGVEQGVQRIRFRRIPSGCARESVATSSSPPRRSLGGGSGVKDRRSLACKVGPGGGRKYGRASARGKRGYPREGRARDRSISALPIEWRGASIDADPVLVALLGPASRLRKMHQRPHERPALAPLAERSEREAPPDARFGGRHEICSRDTREAQRLSLRREGMEARARVDRLDRSLKCPSERTEPA